MDQKLGMGGTGGSPARRLANKQVAASCSLCQSSTPNARACSHRASCWCTAPLLLLQVGCALEGVQQRDLERHELHAQVALRPAIPRAGQGLLATAATRMPATRCGSAQGKLARQADVSCVSPAASHGHISWQRRGGGGHQPLVVAAHLQEGRCTSDRVAGQCHSVSCYAYLVATA